MSKIATHKKRKMSVGKRHNVPRFVMNNFTNPKSTRQKEDYKSFYLRKSTWEAIRISRNWGIRGAACRFAEALGITRQYAWDIITQRCGCSSNVMRKIIGLLGMDRPIQVKGHDQYQCWCSLFEMVSMRECDKSHPIYNLCKYNGEVPYNKYSPSANARSKDYKVEKSAES